MQAAEALVCLVDPSRLMTAILKLAIMARDAMPEGGKLTSRLRPRPCRAETAAARDNQASAGDHIVIAVSASRERDFRRSSAAVFADLGVVQNFIAQSSGHIKICGEAAQAASVKIYLLPATRFVQPPVKLRRARR